MKGGFPSDFKRGFQKKIPEGDLKGDLKQCRDDKEALSGEVTILTATVAARDASIVALEGEKTALAGQVTTLTETVAARDASILTLEGEKAALAGQLDTLQNGRTGQVNGYDIGPNVDLSEADIGSPIAAGVFHSLAIKADGTVVAWGRNNEGQATVPGG